MGSGKSKGLFMVDKWRAPELCFPSSNWPAQTWSTLYEIFFPSKVNLLLKSCQGECREICWCAWMWGLRFPSQPWLSDCYMTVLELLKDLLSLSFHVSQLGESNFLAARLRGLHEVACVAASDSTWHVVGAPWVLSSSLHAPLSLTFPVFVITSGGCEDQMSMTRKLPCKGQV